MAWTGSPAPAVASITDRVAAAAQKAARALGDWEGDDPASALPALRTRMGRLAGDQRLRGRASRDRADALEKVAAKLAELQRLRELRCCLLVPALEDVRRALPRGGGRIAAVRTLLRGAAGGLEAEAGLALAQAAPASLDADDAEDLLLVATFLRRPPPELRVVPLSVERIVRAA